MKSKHTLGAAVVFWLGIAAGLQAQPTPAAFPRRHPLVFPIGIAAPAVQPPASLECVVDFGPAVPDRGGRVQSRRQNAGRRRLPRGLALGFGQCEARQSGSASGSLAMSSAPWPFAKTAAPSWSAKGRRAARRRENPRSSDRSTGGRLSRIPRTSSLRWALSPDGKLVAVGGADRLVHVWNLDDKKLLTAIKEHGDPRSVRVRSAPTASSWPPRAPTGPCGFGKWEAGNCSARMEQTETVHAAAFNPDGSLLALAVGGPDDRAIHIRRSENSQEVRVLDTALGLPLDIVWIAQGNRIFAACSDKTVKVFDANGGLVANLQRARRLGLLRGGSPDGTKLASGSADGTVKLWNMADGRLLATFVQISPRTEQWLIVTPPGYLATSAVGAPAWRPKNLKTPPDKLASLLQNADLLRQTIAGVKTAPPAVQ